MPNETRVNLKHLLEDLRDAYASPIEEVIVTELIANALDSGATHIRLETDLDRMLFRCRDNGAGMNRASLRSYHNIAASTKERGEGIGFAGVGAKLSLLVAEKVVTHSRGTHGTHAAAEWFLKSPFRAPWKFIPFNEAITHGKGTIVSIYLKQADHPLLDAAFLERTVQRHFYPLLCDDPGIRKVLKAVYKKPVSLFVNDRRLEARSLGGTSVSFEVRPRGSRKLLGAGFIEKARMDENFWSRMFGHEPVRPSEGGLRISTYGKVIRGGWEWLGLPVEHPELVSGVVEIPALSEVLTMNKSDFLSTPGALKKYYAARKAIQHAVAPVLRELGEARASADEHKTPKPLKTLAQEPYHVLTVVALTLAQYVQSPEGVPHFVSEFLLSWSDSVRWRGWFLEVQIVPAVNVAPR